MRHILGGSGSGAVFVLGCLSLAGCGSDQEGTGGGGAGGGTTGSGGAETPPGWLKRFGDAASQEQVAIAATPDEGIAVAGGFTGAIDFGGGPLQAAGGATAPEDIYVAKLDSDGNHLWSKRAGDVVQQGSPALAVDGAGNLLVAGHFLGSMDFGGGPLIAGAGGSSFVVKLDASGTQVWARTFPTGKEGISSIAVDGSDNVILAGGFTGTVDFGGGPLVNQSQGVGIPDVFVVKLDASGAHLWSKKFGGAAGGDMANDIVVDSAGSILIAGSAYGEIDFGGGPLSGGSQETSFLTKLDGAGDHVHSKVFGDDDNRVQFRLAVDPEDNVVAAGRLAGSIDLGGETLASIDSAPFLARWDPAGQILTSKLFTGMAEVRAAVGAAGHVHLTGCSYTALDLGGAEPLPTGSGGSTADIFLAELDADLSFVSGEAVTDVGQYGENQCATSITLTPSGALALGGYLWGSVDFGDGAVESAGQADVFVMVRRP